MSETQASSEVEKLKLNFVFSYEQPETALTTRLEQAVYRTLEAYQPPAVNHPVSIDRINIELDELQLTDNNTSNLLLLEQELEQLLVARLDQCFEQLQQEIENGPASDSSRQDLQPIASQHKQPEQPEAEHHIDVATSSDRTQFQITDLLQREYSTTDLLQQLEQPGTDSGIELFPGYSGNEVGSAEDSTAGNKGYFETVPAGDSRDIAGNSLERSIARQSVAGIDRNRLTQPDSLSSAKLLRTKIDRLLQSLDTLSKQTESSKETEKKSRILSETLHQTLQEVRVLYLALDKYTVSFKNASPDAFDQPALMPETLEHQLRQFEKMMRQCIAETAQRAVKSQGKPESLQHAGIPESHNNQHQSPEQSSGVLTGHMTRAQQSGHKPVLTPNDSDCEATIPDKKERALYPDPSTLLPSSPEEKQIRSPAAALYNPDLDSAELSVALIHPELLQLLSFPELPLKLVRVIDQWCRQAQDIPIPSQQRWLQRILTAVEQSPLLLLSAETVSGQPAPQEARSDSTPEQHIKRCDHTSAAIDTHHTRQQPRAALPQSRQPYENTFNQKVSAERTTEDASGQTANTRSATSSVPSPDPELQRKQQQWHSELQQLPLQATADTWHSAIHSWQQALPEIQDRIMLARSIYFIKALLQQASQESPTLKQWFSSRRQRWQQWLQQLDPAQLYLQQFPRSSIQQGIEQIKTLMSVQRRLLRSEHCPVSVRDDNQRRLTVARQILAQQLTFGSRHETFSSSGQTVTDLAGLCHPAKEEVTEVQQQKGIPKTTTSNKAYSSPASNLLDVPDADPDTRASLSQAAADISHSLQQTLRQLEQTLNTEKSRSGPQARYSMPELSANESIEVQNAGLVLLWPHLSRLFNQCELLAADQSFIDICHQHQAMALLEYIAGTDACPEVQQQNRMTTALITGLKPAEIPDTLPTLADSRCQHADQLLAAVISQWSALRDITPAGLRNLFLQRNGHWKTYDNGWKLTVEDKAQDILLQALPWPVSMITLPWLGGLLSVHWKTPAIQLK
ncbi:contractile injection system tape measure protein [Spongorhabdus nitratireducens]